MVLSSGMWYNPRMIREDTRAIREMLRMMGTDDWDLFLAYCPLTRREREIAYMVYREGLSVKEISRETGMSCGNVQRIRRGIYGKIRTFASASVFSRGVFFPRILSRISLLQDILPSEQLPEQLVRFLFRPGLPAAQPSRTFLPDSLQRFKINVHPRAPFLRQSSPSTRRKGSPSAGAGLILPRFSACVYAFCSVHGSTHAKNYRCSLRGCWRKCRAKLKNRKACGIMDRGRAGEGRRCALFRGKGGRRQKAGNPEGVFPHRL